MHDETRASRIGYSIHGLLHMTVGGRLNVTSMRSILGYWEHICEHAQEFVSTWIEIEIYLHVKQGG